MAIAVVQITTKQKDLILGLPEGHFLDLKSKEIRPAALTRAMSAFANADGGELYIGIEEGKKSRKWNGFADDEAANGHIQAFEEFFPYGQYFDYTFLSCDKSRGIILKVEIRKTPDIRAASDGRVYVRRGAQNLPHTSPEQLRRLELNKGIASHENHTVQDHLENVSNSLVIIEFLINIVPTAEPEPWLRKQQLIRNDLPTVACELLFNEEPQVVLPKASIKIYRYKTSEKVGTRDTLVFNPITIEGPAYVLIRDAVNKAIEITEKIPVLGAEGFEQVKYPREAIHEVVTNAVIHRDYSINDDIHIRIFDNRIEVQSPGLLPGHVTVKNILEERFARNPSLVRILNKFPDPPNKDVGEGLNTTFEAMRKLRLKDPVIEQAENNVIVRLIHEKLASYEDIIARYLAQNEDINNSRAREICREGSENKIKRVFERMMKAGIIERIPGRKGKSTAYRLTARKH
jgi:ATP-dependent DNA helicase RecG